MYFPPFPGWDGLHPLVIHFPIALLLLAPLFILIGLIDFSHRIPYLICGLVTMTLGTVGAFVAVSTGEAAAEIAKASPQIHRAIESHEELAETTRTIFTVLTLIFYVLVAVPALMKKEIARLSLTLIHGVFLVLYLSGTLVLIETARQGGLLVHEHGIRADLVEESEVTEGQLRTGADLAGRRSAVEFSREGD